MSSSMRFGDDVKEIGSKLTEAFNSGDTDALQKALSEVVAEMTTGTDVSSLFPYVVKMCGTIDLPCKKLVYLYISQYATENPDLTLLAINSLLKDTEDPNTMVRGLALKTLCNIRLSEFLEYVKKPLLSGLKDRSPYVRQIAVVGSLKVHKINPKFVKDNGIPNFDEMIYDPDPTVVVTVVRTFFEMRKDKQQPTKLGQKTAIHLLNRLSEFNDWGKASILQYLLLYQPQGEEEVFDVLNLLDPLLSSSNSSVSVAAIKLMLQYTRELPSVQNDIYKKLRGILVNLLSHEQEELVYLSLCHLHQLQKNSCINLSKHYKKLFCRYDDPVHIKCLKIDLLVMICSDKNWKEVLEELNSHCLDVSSEVSGKSIGGIAALARKNPVCIDPAMKMLIYLLDVDRVAGSALDILKDLLDVDAFQPFLPDVLSLIPSLWNRVDDQKGKTALLWVIGQHGEGLPDAPYLLESMIDNLQENPRPILLSSLLTATTKLFFTRPAECQDMLGKLLEFSVVHQEDMNLKEKGQLYYRLLSEDLSLAKDVICSAKFGNNIEEVEGNGKLHLNSLQMFFKLKSELELSGVSSSQSSAKPEVDESTGVATPTEGQLIDFTGGHSEVNDNEGEGQMQSEVDPTVNTTEGNDETSGLLETLSTVQLTNDRDQNICIDPAESLRDLGDHMPSKSTAETSASLVDPRSSSGEAQELTASVIEDGAQVEGATLQLEKSFLLAPEDFESRWTLMDEGQIEQVELTFDLTASLEALEKAGVNTIASTDEGTFPWKAFLYAKDADTGTIFLMEFVINTEGSQSADVQLKCSADDGSSRLKFKELLKKILNSEV